MILSDRGLIIRDNINSQNILYKYGIGKLLVKMSKVNVQCWDMFVLSFGIVYAYDCSVPILLFRYGIDNWNWCVGICIFEVEFVIGV